MTAFDWNPYLTGGGTRPDAISGLDANFNSSLARMFASAPPEIRSQLRIKSAYRSTDRQQELWDAAVAKYGSPEAARKWVAPPGKSQHNHGNAADLEYLSPAAKEWMHANAQQYGLHFPMAHEPWHIEPVGARGGAPAAPGASPPSGPGTTPAGNPAYARLAFAYANGKMSPEDEALYEQGMAAGDFPMVKKVREKTRPAADTALSEYSDYLEARKSQRPSFQPIDLGFTVPVGLT